ncbi:hypothetical protein [Massilia glaciei]|uniref:Flagellar hook-associated protein 2 C-terminal domain-containing protein n=1 Tax=Massilia glaciei TaxID=1524097 RepID=A0A2U2HMD1_9BURK|nr:hypothetical protein [Massilia glaciei]PWF48596.1 hypothetical protein C7C56_010845 [Massilia glaciei]
MPISPINAAALSVNLAQFKGQALASLFNTAAQGRSPPPAAGGFGEGALPDRFSGTLPAPAGGADFRGVLDRYSALFTALGLPTPTTPTGLDSSRPFSQPGQNMVTVLNRVEVSFKAQFSELAQMRTSLALQQDAARQLTGVDAHTPNAQLKGALDNFVASYNGGVERFSPELAAGGILEGSWEAARARFATARDIGHILNGHGAGVRGGLATLGISTDPKTGMAAVDHAKLDAALADNKAGHAAAITDFATAFVGTVDSLTATGHAQQRQMANLERAVHWIDANKAAVQKEFGPGAAATPNAAFARAAARYDAMALLAKGGV